MKTKVLGSEATIGQGSGNGSNFGSATVVRVYNEHNANTVVSIEDSSANLIGTFTLKTGDKEFVEKNPSDEIFVNTGSVKGVGVAITT